jgi:hypothetical protein
MRRLAFDRVDSLGLNDFLGVGEAGADVIRGEVVVLFEDLLRL